jgi:hypothetical protein
MATAKDQELDMLKLFEGRNFESPEGIVTGTVKKIYRDSDRFVWCDYECKCNTSSNPNKVLKNTILWRSFMTIVTFDRPNYCK